VKLEGLSSIRKIARFLGTEEGEVTRLLEEDRLGGTLVAVLGRRGVPVTPNVKTSVETIVRSMAPKRKASAAGTERAYLLESEATVTIMFTDVVDSAGITELLGDRQAQDVIGEHNEIVRRQTKNHGGIEVKAMGDGFMLTFPSAKRAVSAAIAMQRDLNSTEFLRPEVAIAIKLGLSVGEPIRDQKDLFGMSVVLASRIGAKAAPGQILTSQIVYALLGNTGGFDFAPAGEHGLKGISGLQKLYEVNWRGE
jgi:class 3 adenylate cyclase